MEVIVVSELLSVIGVTVKGAPDAPVCIHVCLAPHLLVIDKDKFNCSHKRSPLYSTVDTRGGGHLARGVCSN